MAPVRESRVKKSLTNAKVNLSFYFIILLLSFFSRRIFLENLGADFVGFTGTVGNLLGFLNLAELGIASAIGYVLYQPLFDNDREKITDIISVFGFLYRRIGLIILCAGIILSLFLPLIFHKSDINIGIVYFGFYVYLSSSLIGYFANYKQTLLAADQRNYVVTAYFQTTSIIRICVQMYLAYKTHSWFLWLAIELFFGVIYSFILNWKINKVYPWLNSDVKQGKTLLKSYPEILKFTKQLFIHKIAGFIQFQTNPFIIYTFTSLSTVACYGNYMMLINSLLNFVNKFLGSTEAGVGNLVASKDNAKIISVYKELTSIRYYIAGIEIFGLYMFSAPFISLWIGEEYVLSNLTVSILLIYIFIMQTRGTNDQFIFAHGLFGDVWAAIAEMAISLGSALVLGYFYGLPGVISGGVIGMTLIVNIWKPYYLFSQGFKISTWRYWQFIMKLLAIIAGSFCLSNILESLIFPSAINTWMELFIKMIVVTLIYVVISFGLFYLFDNGMRLFVFRIKHQLIKR